MTGLGTETQVNIIDISWVQSQRKLLKIATCCEFWYRDANPNLVLLGSVKPNILNYHIMTYERMISQKVGSFDFIFVFLTYSCSFSEIGWLDLVTAILCFTCIEVGPRRIQFASRNPVVLPAWCGTPTENPQHSTGHVDSREISPGHRDWGRPEPAAESWSWLTGECRDHMFSLHLVTPPLATELELAPSVCTGNSQLSPFTKLKLLTPPPLHKYTRRQ